jgi:exopolyphosphatase/guanosine-5'-triphosphate,3'-diphosphate pyrophosphatase
VQKHIAIIDIGSRSVKLEIYALKDGTHKLMFKASEPTFLGRNMQHGEISEVAMTATLDALRTFKNHINNYDEVKIYAIATAAMRIAKNARTFSQEILRVLGDNAEFEIIPGEREAYYDYLGAVNTLSIRDFLLIDVGGASTELALVKDRKLIKSVSLNFGSLSITERFFRDNVQAHNISEAEHSVKQELDKIDWLKDARGLPIVGLGSSIYAMGKYNLQRAMCRLGNVTLHNHKILHSTFNFIYKLISKTMPEVRRDKLGISKGVADVVLGGLVPLKCVFDIINTRRVYISLYGLRYGVLTEKFAHSIGLISPIEPDVTSSSVLKLQAKTNCDIEHAENVEALALNLFDQTSKLHYMGDRYRSLLSIAAKLHDCGAFVQYNNHHLHSFYLIKESEIFGLNARDRLIVAIIAGMHRKEKLKFNRWKYFCFIDRNTYKHIKSLGVMLGIAEETSRIAGGARQLKCNIQQTAILIDIVKNNEKLIQPYQATGEHRKLNASLFGRNVLIK